MQHQKSKINKNQNKTEDVVFDNYYGEHSYHRLMWSGHSFCHICECVCLSVCIALTSESLNFVSSFCRYVFRMSGQKSQAKSMSVYPDSEGWLDIYRRYISLIFVRKCGIFSMYTIFSIFLMFSKISRYFPTLPIVAVLSSVVYHVIKHQNAVL